jgi:hypothetical protein
MESAEQTLNKTLDYVVKHIKKNSQADFAKLALALWENKTSGLVEYELNGRKYWTSKELIGTKDVGLESWALKDFPVVGLLQDMDSLSNAEAFLSRIFLATAKSMPEAVKDSTIDLLDIKLTTLKQICTSVNIVKKKILDHQWLSVENYEKMGNKSEEVDYKEYFSLMDSEEMAEIGIELIRSGQVLKKENKGRWVRLRTTKGHYVEIYFSDNPNEKSNRFLTHGRCATVTAYQTAKVLLEHEDMPALGLNIGWQSLSDDNALANLNQILTNLGVNNVNKQDIYMISIPKLKPNRGLVLSKGQAILMLAFHIINDAYNTSKRSDGKYISFTREIYSKLGNVGIYVSGSDLLAVLKYAAPKCIKAMKHKTVIPRDIVNLLKAIVKTIETWKTDSKRETLEVEDAAATEADLQNLFITGAK